MAVSDGIIAESLTITGAHGEEIEAYLARALRDGPLGGVVVIHHMPGYDAATKEITRRFATLGYNAICPNLYSRESAGAGPEEAATAVRAAGGVPDDRLVGDVEGAAAQLRRLRTSNRRVGVIGFCSGGRQAFLAACRLSLDAAVDCYGAFVVGAPPPGSQLRAGPIVQLARDLSCPLLGLFGAQDTHPSPDEVAELDQALRDADKPHEFRVFENAGHAFFAVDRPSYSPEAAVDGWRLITHFFEDHVASGGAAPD